MATINLKLVGLNTNNYIIKTSSYNFFIRDLKNIFNSKNITNDDINNIKIISNGIVINDFTDSLVSIEVPEVIIYLHANSIELLEKINMNLNPASENLYNKEIIELFKDKTFVTLLRICKEKPDYLNKVASYISNGNITTSIHTIDKSIFKYHQELIILKNIIQELNYKIDDNIMWSILQHFEGNINMSLRFILSS
jgi:hypothetical protein